MKKIGVNQIENTRIGIALRYSLFCVNGSIPRTILMGVSFGA